jgi:hypothetical protein
MCSALLEGMPFWYVIVYERSSRVVKEMLPNSNLEIRHVCEGRQKAGKDKLFGSTSFCNGSGGAGTMRCRFDLSQKKAASCGFRTC